MATLDISNVINVSNVTVPIGLSNFNVHNIALFSNDAPIASFSSTYRAYKRASDVATDFGVESTTYKMAAVIFAQDSSILSADGTLFIVRLLPSESLLSAIARIEGSFYYTGILDTLTISDSDSGAVFEDTARAIQATSRVWVHGFSSSTEAFALGVLIKNAALTQTRVLLNTLSELDAQLFAAAYLSLGMSVDFTGSNTAMTMNLKTLTGVNIDTGITQTMYNAAKIDGVDLYVSYGTEGVFSTGGNDFFDNVYNTLWLKLALQVAGFNYLKTINTKIPQTESGMDGLKNSQAVVFQQAVNNGVLAKGLNWNSADVFGDPVSLKRNITEQGYYIYSAPIAGQSEADRVERKAPLIQSAVKFAGAIHTATIINYIEY